MNKIMNTNKLPCLSLTEHSFHSSGSDYCNDYSVLLELSEYPLMHNNKNYTLLYEQFQNKSFRGDYYSISGPLTFS